VWLANASNAFALHSDGDIYAGWEQEWHFKQQNKAIRRFFELVYNVLAVFALLGASST
jgi:hypothetical protein